jgi:hypothetical protein
MQRTCHAAGKSLKRFNLFTEQTTHNQQFVLSREAREIRAREGETDDQSQKKHETEMWKGARKIKKKKEERWMLQIEIERNRESL